MDIEATADCEYRDSSEEEEDDRRFSLTTDITPRRLSSSGKSAFTSRQSFRLIESFYDTPNHQKKAGDQLRRSFVVSREHMALGDAATMFDSDQQSPNATTFAADSSHASSCDDGDVDSCDTLDLLVRADSDSVAGLSQDVRTNTDSTQLPAARRAIRADEFIFPHRLTHQTTSALHSASNHSLSQSSLPSLPSLPSMGSMPCVLVEDAFRSHCESPLPTLQRAPSPAQDDALPTTHATQAIQAMQAQLHELLSDVEVTGGAEADREWSYAALSATVFRSAAARLCWRIAALAAEADLPLCALQHLLPIVALYEEPQLVAAQWSADSSPIAEAAAGDEADDGPAGFLVAVLQQLALQWLAMEDAERGLGLLTTAAELRQRIFGSDGELTAFPAQAAQRVCRLVRLEHRLYALQDRLPLDVAGLATDDVDEDLDDRARELRVHVDVAQVFVAEELWPAALHHFHQALALLAAPSVYEGAADDDAAAQLELRAQLCMSLSWLYAQLRDEAPSAYYEGEAAALRRRLYAQPDGDGASPSAASRAPSPVATDDAATPLDGAAQPTAAAAEPSDAAASVGDGCVVS